MKTVFFRKNLSNSKNGHFKTNLESKMSEHFVSISRNMIIALNMLNKQYVSKTYIQNKFFYFCVVTKEKLSNSLNIMQSNEKWMCSISKTCATFFIFSKK